MCCSDAAALKVDSKSNHTVVVASPTGERQFAFDSVHTDKTSQQALFTAIADDVIASALDKGANFKLKRCVIFTVRGGAGVSSCVFAVGAEGSGKSYSVIGDKNNRGLLPLT